MKGTEKKLEYVKARAEGKSYSTIARELHISKSTCSNWERELEADIRALKEERLEELFSSYRMTREARIAVLGGVLNEIDTALQEKDLRKIPADKLLELKLKYVRELKADYTEPIEDTGGDTTEGLLEQYNRLYTASKSGKYSPAQIKAQLAILDAKKQTLIALDNEKWIAG